MYESESVRCEMRCDAMRQMRLSNSARLQPEHDQAAQQHCTR
jgi:hypothetical protein